MAGPAPPSRAQQSEHHGAKRAVRLVERRPRYPAGAQPDERSHVLQIKLVRRAAEEAAEFGNGRHIRSLGVVGSPATDCGPSCPRSRLRATPRRVCGRARTEPCQLPPVLRARAGRCGANADRQRKRELDHASPSASRASTSAWGLPQRRRERTATACTRCGFSTKARFASRSQSGQRPECLRSRPISTRSRARPAFRAIRHMRRRSGLLGHRGSPFPGLG
jgi:hypothetical protein